MKKGKKLTPGKRRKLLDDKKQYGPPDCFTGSVVLVEQACTKPEEMPAKMQSYHPHNCAEIQLVRQRLSRAVKDGVLPVAADGKNNFVKMADGGSGNHSKRLEYGAVDQNSNLPGRNCGPEIEMIYVVAVDEGATLNGVSNCWIVFPAHSRAQYKAAGGRMALMAISAGKSTRMLARTGKL